MEAVVINLFFLLSNSTCDPCLPVACLEFATGSLGKSITILALSCNHRHIGINGVIVPVVEACTPWVAAV